MCLVKPSCSNNTVFYIAQEGAHKLVKRNDHSSSSSGHGHGTGASPWGSTCPSNCPAGPPGPPGPPGDKGNLLPPPAGQCCTQCYNINKKLLIRICCNLY